MTTINVATIFGVHWGEYCGPHTASSVFLISVLTWVALVVSKEAPPLTGVVGCTVRVQVSVPGISLTPTVAVQAARGRRVQLTEKEQTGMLLY